VSALFLKNNKYVIAESNSSQYLQTKISISKEVIYLSNSSFNEFQTQMSALTDLDWEVNEDVILGTYLQTSGDCSSVTSQMPWFCVEMPNSFVLEVPPMYYTK